MGSVLDLCQLDGESGLYCCLLTSIMSQCKCKPDKNRIRREEELGASSFNEFNEFDCSLILNSWAKYSLYYSAISSLLCLCDLVHHYRATFTPVSRGDLHLGAGCSAVQAVLYTVQGTGVHTPLYAMVRSQYHPVVSWTVMVAPSPQLSVK